MDEEKRLHDLGGGTAFAAHFSGKSYLKMLTHRG